MPFHGLLTPAVQLGAVPQTSVVNRRRTSTRIPRATPAERRTSSMKRKRSKDLKRNGQEQEISHDDSATTENDPNTLPLSEQGLAPSEPAHSSSVLSQQSTMANTRPRNKLHRAVAEGDNSSEVSRRQAEEEIQANLQTHLKRQTERKAYDKELARHTHRLWGFDPRAGLTPRRSEGWSHMGGCMVRPALNAAEIPGVFYESEDMSGSRDKQFLRGWKWGVESGGPGKEGHFAHGQLKGRQSLGLVADHCRAKEKTWHKQRELKTRS